MLKTIRQQGLVDFCQKQPETWQEAIRLSAQKLIQAGIVTDSYVDEVIQSVTEFGPYIVILPGVAMPHARADSPGVLGTAVAFTHFPQPVYFEAGNEEKQAQLFFMLAAKDAEAHMQNLAELADFLMQETIITRLQKLTTMAELECFLGDDGTESGG